VAQRSAIRKIFRYFLHADLPRLYLYHNLLIAVAVLGLMHFEIQGDWARALWICVWAFGGSLALAALSYRWIEEPGIRLGRAVARRKMRQSSVNNKAEVNL
jgi:peptidoglycan/LPS O-acetylase OafA/YrhL